MAEKDELRIGFTEEQFRRLEETADFSGFDPEDWARRTLLRILEARETREANGER